MGAQLTISHLREVLELAEGCSNTAITQRLFGTDGTVAKHISDIFAKLRLPPDSDSNRRVLAVPAHLNA
ncbi:hypothetical protein [Kitasatospora sp. NPDC059673]|uniref:hypothetical protein n=1 Tax=Kitasatospora sp. NPDC059673 TaxID=3346901 RepID=UPI00369296DD